MIYKIEVLYYLYIEKGAFKMVSAYFDVQIIILKDTYSCILNINRLGTRQKKTY